MKWTSSVVTTTDLLLIWMRTKTKRRLIYVCSPYSGETQFNTRRARGYSLFVVSKGHVPLAPHLLFPQFLDKIENGIAVVDQEAATRVKELYRIYLSGLSLSNAAKEAGIKGYHASIARMLTNMRYLGDGYYPQIIDEEIFEKAEAERLRRAEMLGRIREPSAKKKNLKRYRFSMEKPEQLYDDPFKQAEYAYSLIESEVIEDGNE